MKEGRDREFVKVSLNDLEYLKKIAWDTKAPNPLTPQVIAWVIGIERRHIEEKSKHNV